MFESFLEIILALVLIIVEVGALAVLILFLISGANSFLYGAPFVPIKKKLVKNILTWADVSSEDIFYDLGCGDGRVLVSAAGDFNIARSIGYEASLWPYWLARYKIQQANLAGHVKIIRKNFLDSEASFSEATFIYAYLSPKLVDRLAVKIARECMSGTRVLCPSFSVDLARHPEFRLLKSEKLGKITAYLYQRR